ncbi:Peptide chain release factor 1 [Chlamydiales bacterium SCGC AB-751-O23]|jgi:peptide chain release factor 1|nr:Peptide chain release factor 1 [Chlamydiales bacterium SCGC AB-751-O23]
MNLKKKIERLILRLEEVEQALGDPGVYSDQKRYKALSQEHSHLSDIKSCHQQIEALEGDLLENKELKGMEEDESFIEDLEKEIETNLKDLELKKKELQNLLVPPSPYDNNNTILEMRAGTGGDEAALFVGDCVRMYRLFADKHNWTYEVLSSSTSDMGGFKECSLVLSGKNVYRNLQYEAGTHRVQRVPETEAQGRVHTSAVTVAVLMEPGEEESVKIEEKDLRIDTYRSSGAGGQHVNTTDSAVRMTHEPTGIVVTCQSERSQIKNRDICMRLLKAKVTEAMREKAHQEQSDQRASQIGSGDRSERIRTYNFPQNRITDHRINLTRYHLDRAIMGDLDEFSNALVAHFYNLELEA